MIMIYYMLYSIFTLKIIMNVYLCAKIKKRNANNGKMKIHNVGILPNGCNKNSKSKVLNTDGRGWALISGTYRAQ